MKLKSNEFIPEVTTNKSKYGHSDFLGSMRESNNRFRILFHQRNKSINGYKNEKWKTKAAAKHHNSLRYFFSKITGNAPNKNTCNAVHQRCVNNIIFGAKTSKMSKKTL